MRLGNCLFGFGVMFIEQIEQTVQQRALAAIAERFVGDEQHRVNQRAFCLKRKVDLVEIFG